MTIFCPPDVAPSELERLLADAMPSTALVDNDPIPKALGGTELWLEFAVTDLLSITMVM